MGKCRTHDSDLTAIKTTLNSHTDLLVGIKKDITELAKDDAKFKKRFFRVENQVGYLQWMGLIIATVLAALIVAHSAIQWM